MIARLTLLAALVWMTPAVAQSGGTYLTDDAPLISISPVPSGVKRPEVVSDDYRRAVCDVARIMNRGASGWMSITLGYDDGEVSFNCARDLTQPK